MRRGTSIFCILAGALLATSLRSAAEDQAPPLSVNPFERPAWISDVRTAPAGALPAKRRQSIDLRATLVSGRGSLANVGGRIIGIGEEVDGYLLLSIEEGRAVFRNNDEVIRVSVVTDDEDKDDEDK
jgi:hypothetical protein